MTKRIPELQNYNHSGESRVRRPDIVDLLPSDPGRFTLEELLQQREAALHEIISLGANCSVARPEPLARDKAIPRAAG